jgi:predicted NAD/FAD-binding protein
MVARSAQDQNGKTFCLSERSMVEATGFSCDGAEVVGVARRPDGVRVRFVDAGRQHQTLTLDHVVLAVRSLQVIAILEDASEEEKQAYEGFSWQRARVVVHRGK